MDNIYRVNDIKERIKDSIYYYEDRIKAWENVKRLYKNDGTPFKILSKNFAGCSFTSEYGWDKKVKVYFTNHKGSYDSDYIDLFYSQYTGEQKLDTPDKVEQAIKDLIEHYKEYMDMGQHDLELCDTVIEDFAKTVQRALDRVSETVQSTTTYYACREFMKNVR